MAKDKNLLAVVVYLNINLLIEACNFLLPVGEMPAHSHTATVDTTAAHTHQYKYTNGFANPSSAGSLTRQEWLRPVETIDTSASGAHSHSVNISNAGNNQQHNNIQPYIVATLWKRIA